MKDLRRAYEATAVPYEAISRDPHGTAREMRSLDLYGAKVWPVLRG